MPRLHLSFSLFLFVFICFIQSFKHFFVLPLTVNVHFTQFLLTFLNIDSTWQELQGDHQYKACKEYLTFKNVN